MKAITHALLGFLAGTALLGFIAVTTSCAHKPLHRAKKMQPPAAQLAIPVSCIDQVLHGTEKTRCEAVDPAHPDVALCGPVLIHFNCTKVVQSHSQK
jgi:hypothetical protein